MTWKRGGRGYHHGNLREVLIQAALDLIAEKGPSGFNVAEAARSAGVNPAAPYRHFRDRDELLVDVAIQGFGLFAEALETAWDEGRPDAHVAFERVGRAYLAFARAEPAYYTTMFESGLPHSATPQLREAAERSYAVLRQASETLVADLPTKGRPPASMVSFHIWAFTHGIASLFGRSDEGRRKLPISPEDLLEAGMLIYLQGLEPKS
ncbi:TetR/AcrR family transcriptional regulator [Breoghania sp.]|uniref:TetR/AcrR family transcriptional regulator n=1 Tax=Breoghania sp. TaxID=2065378 RepID=UPI0026339739|nr:TetR/AcrR family transcriptional regulator [Breoghania sp.]MDJ0931388.1 TetR/AcrR family transcriptional regulator [Breoghania sp.]